MGIQSSVVLGARDAKPSTANAEAQERLNPTPHMKEPTNEDLSTSSKQAVVPSCVAVVKACKALALDQAILWHPKPVLYNIKT